MVCSPWQSLGLWAMIGATILICAPVFIVVGWKAHAIRQWHRRTMLQVRLLGPAMRLTVKVAVGAVLAGFLLYGWLVY